MKTAILTPLQREKAEEIALNLLREGFPIDAIAHGTGLSIEEVQQLQQRMNETPQNL